MEQTPSKLTPLGRLISLVLVIGLIAFGGYMLSNRFTKGGSGGGSTPGKSASGDTGEAPAVVDFKAEVPRLAPAAPFTMKDNIVPIEISEYAGYAGIIAANGGLEPSENSIFYKLGGFKVKLTVSEDESWGDLNQGKIAGSVTTVDVLAAYGRQFHAVVPVQIGYSRGADGLIVRSEIKKINDLKGKLVATSQFTEADFFIRYLAQEAGVPVAVLRDLDSKPASSELGLVFYEDAFVACDAYAHELGRANPRLHGCVGWTPRTDEVVEKSNGKAKVLVSNRNLLVIADVLAVNRGFAKEHPDMVRGLVHGILEGNKRLRDQQAANIGVVAKAFGWSEDEARDELAHVHLANLPENNAFFAGTIDSAGSFGGIFQSSVLAYGELLKNPTDAARFADTSALEALTKKGLYPEQRIAIAPIKTATQASLEGDPLLSKDIRFFFEPNSSVLDKDAKQNLDYLDTIKRFLQVSPGSTVLLRGHVDNARVDEFRQQGGEQLVKSMALKAMELSRQRALAVSEALRGRYKDIDASRVEVVGRGWEEPAGPDSETNRRVEVQWFTLE